MDNATRGALFAMAYALREEAGFLGDLQGLPEPDKEIALRQISSYYRLADSLVHAAAAGPEVKES